MNIGKTLYILSALILFLIITIFSLPEYAMLLLISLFLLVSSYLLLVKKCAFLLSIPVNEPLTKPGKDILFISGIIALIAIILVFVQGIMSFINK